MKTHYNHSGYDRIEHDDYQTEDRRCAKALIESWPIRGRVVDCCAPFGSKLVDHLIHYKKDAHCIGNAFEDFSANWIVTNPPYKKDIVDNIVSACLDKLEDGRVNGVAILVRATWDFASCRTAHFERNFACQVHMRFRPWWGEERIAQPQHNFVWNIWEKTGEKPTIKWWNPR